MKNNKHAHEISDENDGQWCNNIAATWMWRMEKNESLYFQAWYNKLFGSEDWNYDTPMGTTITGELIGLWPEP